MMAVMPEAARELQKGALGCMGTAQRWLVL
jgi:hypothetical protein